jgi:LAO/AO transport system kinase
MVSYQPLIERMLRGDRVALSRLMTLVESRGAERPHILTALNAHGRRAAIVGVTGPPGAGKSTLLDQLVARYRASKRQVGIVAVDPSSPFSGGAVLGDRIRMQSHFLDEGVFIRSLSARGHVGGLARATRDMTRLLEAYGKDVIIVETVGVGQSELDIMRLAHTVVVVLVPEAGDTIQAMKAGLLEIADVFVVNKSDREGAERIKSELAAMLHLRPANEWQVPVISTVATDGRGVEDVMTAIHDHQTYLQRTGELMARAQRGRRQEFLAALHEELARGVEESTTRGGLAGVMAEVEKGTLDPDGAVLQVMRDPALLASVLPREIGRAE